MPSSRQLTVIMLTDITGSTAVAEPHRNRSFSVIKKHRDALKSIVPKYNGKVQKFKGDRSICLFPTQSAAVDCAKEIQLALQKDVQLRIGIHDGEIIEANGNTYVNGVDCTYEIESCGHPGTILFSKGIHDKIKQETTHTDVLLGSFRFNSIKKPMEIYGLTDEGLKAINKSEIKNNLSTGVSSKTNLAFDVHPPSINY